MRRLACLWVLLGSWGCGYSCDCPSDFVPIDDAYRVDWGDSPLHGAEILVGADTVTVLHTLDGVLYEATYEVASPGDR